MDETYHVKLIKKKSGIYTVYVFQKDNNEYVMCTQLPNWGNYNISKGDTGFLSVIYANAGDEYYERSTGVKRIYQFDQCYLKEFIPDDKTENTEIVL